MLLSVKASLRMHMVGNEQSRHKEENPLEVVTIKDIMPLPQALCYSINATIISTHDQWPSSFGSPIPSARMAKIASLSGKQGLSYILHILCSPLPFFRDNRVVEA